MFPQNLCNFTTIICIGSANQTNTIFCIFLMIVAIDSILCSFS